jgi:hypothetical protein
MEKVYLFPQIIAPEELIKFANLCLDCLEDALSVLEEIDRDREKETFVGSSKDQKETPTAQAE